MGGSRALSALKTQAYGREASNFLWFLRGGKVPHESPASYGIGHDHQLPVRILPMASRIIELQHPHRRCKHPYNPCQSNSTK